MDFCFFIFFFSFTNQFCLFLSSGRYIDRINVKYERRITKTNVFIQLSTIFVDLSYVRFKCGSIEKPLWITYNLRNFFTEFLTLEKKFLQKNYHKKILFLKKDPTKKIFPEKKFRKISEEKFYKMIIYRYIKI